MEPQTTAIRTKKIVKQFAAIVQGRAIDLISSLLADEGEFNAG